MNNIEKQEDITLKAIENYELYTRSQRDILAALYKLSIDCTSVIQVSSLSKLIGYSRFTVYKNIKKLQEDGALKLLEGARKSLNHFKLNENKLQLIIDRYNKKKNFT